MLKVDEIQNGVVIDHITAGTGLALYHMMELEKLNNASVALLQNVRSQKDGKKDIIKIEGLKRTGGYCPCRLQHIPENICICSEFKQQLADPDYHGPCHCGLYVKD